MLRVKPPQPPISLSQERRHICTERRSTRPLYKRQHKQQQHHIIAPSPACTCLLSKCIRTLTHRRVTHSQSQWRAAAHVRLLLMAMPPTQRFQPGITTIKLERQVCMISTSTTPLPILRHMMRSQMQLRNKTHGPQLQSVDSCPSNDAARDTLMRSTTPAHLLPAVPGVQHTASRSSSSCCWP